MNLFDAAVLLSLAVAIVMGFRSGLLRSLATIVGYVVAAPLAVAAAGFISPLMQAHAGQRPPAQDGVLFFILFLFIGIALGAGARAAVSEIAGEQVSAPDRLAGALLGAVRIGLIAILLVLVFDRLIPPGHEPVFLTGSRLRPMLSEAGARGLRSLPPDVAQMIDRMKNAHGL
jgi:membrane protein required for colicin V production